MSINDGGPAFPQVQSSGLVSVHMDGSAVIDKEAKGGMSLRDWFAGQALTSLADVDPRLPGEVPQHDYVWPTPEKLAERRAKWAYLQADAMLAARNSTPTKGD